jgi:flagellar biosynthesis protein FliP
MAPVADKVYVEAVKPYLDDKLDANTALALAAVPVRAFMFEQTRESDITLVHRDVWRHEDFARQGRRAVHDSGAVVHHQ